MPPPGATPRAHRTRPPFQRSDARVGPAGCRGGGARVGGDAGQATANVNNGTLREGRLIGRSRSGL